MMSDFYPSRNATRGFTLIELMIVVAVVAIIMAIALPAYTDSIRKARRATAKSALVDLAARQEKYYAMNNRYADTLSLLGYSSASPNQFDVVNDGGAVYYQVKLTVTPATTSGDPAKFSATATPAGDQAKDPCGSLLLDSIGRQDVSGTAKKGCW